MNPDFQNQEQTPEPQSKVKPPQKKQEPEDLNGVFKRISDDFSDVAPLTALASKLNVEPGQLILALIFTAFTLTIFGAGSLIVNILIGMLYPGYMSVQCIKQQNDNKAKLWVSYWIIFLFSFLMDRFVWFFMTDLQSLYHPVKTMFLIWMYYPRTRGSIIIYDRIIEKLTNLGLFDKPKKE